MKILSANKFVPDVTVRLSENLSKYGDSLYINAGFVFVDATIRPSSLMSIKLRIGADVVREPDGAKVVSKIIIDCSGLCDPSEAILMASVIHELATLGLIIESNYTDTTVTHDYLQAWLDEQLATSEGRPPINSVFGKDEELY